jgi:hypothetical protein
MYSYCIHCFVFQARTFNITNIVRFAMMVPNMSLQGCKCKAFLSKRERMGSILNVYSFNQTDMERFVQHLEPWACVRMGSVVFPPHWRSVKKEKK